MPYLYAQILKHCLSIFFVYSSLRKNSNALHSLLKRVVSTFSKDTGELASSFLEFMRQILNSDTMVSIYICIWYFSYLQTYAYVRKITWVQKYLGMMLFGTWNLNTIFFICPHPTKSMGF